MHHRRTSSPSLWRRLLWMVVALLLAGNQSAFRVGVRAARAAQTVACCHCPPGHCHCGHMHKSAAHRCTRTGKSCLCTATPVRHEQAGLVHADWPPTLLAVVAPPVAPPVSPWATTAGMILTGWNNPPPLPPPQVG